MDIGIKYDTYRPVDIFWEEAGELLGDWVGSTHMFPLENRTY